MAKRGSLKHRVSLGTDAWGVYGSQCYRVQGFGMLEFSIGFMGYRAPGFEVLG